MGAFFKLLLDIGWSGLLWEVLFLGKWVLYKKIT